MCAVLAGSRGEDNDGQGKLCNQPYFINFIFFLTEDAVMVLASQLLFYFLKKVNQILY